MKRRTGTILATVIAVVAASSAALFALPASAETAAFTVQSSWTNGYQGQITVNNDRSTAISTWKVDLTLPAGTTVTQAWNATLATSGSTYTFTPAGWNAGIPAGGSTSFGFIVSGTGRPTACLVNGVSCTGTTNPSPSPSSSSPAPSPSASNDGTPVGINGQLKVCGTKLCNESGQPVQLKGMSTHGLQWFPACYTDASLDWLAGDWNADLLRISMYVQEQGYETDPAGFTARVNALVDEASERGMYALIDFHILTPGDPAFNLERAKTFFAQVSARHANKKNVIYEIANEPNGVSWAQIKNYADQVIPVIRANDPDGVVIVGTRGWSSLGVSEGGNSAEIVSNPVSAANVMYAFHFYAASHKDNYRAEVERAAASLPLFVTEFGTVTYTGDGAVDTASTNAWLDLLDRLKIGYANWTFSDASEGSAALKPGTCAAGAFSGTSVLTESGALLRNRLRAG
ncbi:cellulase family glycosylhydrolase [Actinoplanes derwentensis]|uniref:Endoglucanase n=1 Tax=Actinoplanes derwentensis TaxID=113562 RepID=A0A1H1QCI3_9ACTN|nr:cellulase family glycosylhydrolase [Actinoplanes derwentensis]GID82173.1 endoglucanase [Actinoplanes derwentensis]SDS21202.1 endoglucanase [Actinoplanes derwentensis]